MLEENNKADFNKITKKMKLKIDSTCWSFWENMGVGIISEILLFYQRMLDIVTTSRYFTAGLDTEGSI